MNQKNKIHVMFISNSSSLYGANRSLLNILEKLDKSKFKAYVIIPSEGPLCRQLRKIRVNYRFLYLPESVYKVSGKRHLLKFIFNTGKAFGRLISIINTLEIDIIHSNTSVLNIGALAATFLHKKHIWHIRETSEQFQHRQIMPQLNRRMLHCADNVICISKYVFRDLEKYHAAERAIILHDGLSLEDYCIQRTETLEKGNLNVLICGVIDEHKGQRLLVEALYKLKEKGIEQFKATIVGDGNLKYIQLLKDMIDSYNLKEQIQFHQFEENLLDLRNEADIAIMSSRYEALGRTTIEAMLGELLVIGADSGATGEIIHHMKTGLLYRSEDALDLADKLEYVLNHREKCKLMIKRAKDYAVREFDAVSYTRKLEDIYVGLME